MHSGTQLLRYQLFKDLDVTGFHVDSAYDHLDDLEGVIVAPLRHPRRIAKSFKSRKRSRTKWTHSTDQLYFQLDLMMQLDKQYNIMYICIDTQGREAQLSSVASRLQVQIPHNWEVCAASGAHAGNHDTPLEECPSMPAKYIDFYNSKVHA